MAETLYNETRWPIVLITAPKDVTAEDFDDHLRNIERYYDRGEPFALVLDMRGSTEIGPDRRKRIADLIQRKEAVFPATSAGSGVRRGLRVSADHREGMWFFPPDWPMRPFNTSESALYWADRQLLRARWAFNPPYK